ncbi:MAG: SdpI family protein, partial [Anaerotignum sp.]
QNYFTGVKTPWSLSNDVVWNKTQRLGGKTFFFGGILMLIAIFAVGQDILKWIVIAITAFICLVPTVMSYVWYQQEMRKSEE